jgi:hypothetical protein
LDLRQKKWLKIGENYLMERCIILFAKYSYDDKSLICDDRVMRDARDKREIHRKFW